MSVSFSTTHGELSAALSVMTALGDRRPVTPILTAMMIGVSKDGVTLETFNYETHAAVSIKARAIRTDPKMPSFLVSRSQLAGYVQSLTAGSTRAKQAGLPMTVSVSGAIVTIKADDYEYTLPTMAGDYPHLPVKASGNLVTVDRDAMLAAVTRLQISAGTDATLPMLTGVNIRTVDGGLEMATTDRFRLSVAFVPKTKTRGGIDDTDINTLLQAKELSKILRYLPAGPIECELPGRGNAALFVRFSSGNVSIATRWMDNEFVKYAMLVPQKDSGQDVVVPRGELSTAVKRAAVVVDRGHHVKVSIAGSKVQVSAGGEDGSMTSRQIHTEQAGDDLLGPIGLNPQYIGQALAAFRSDGVAVRYSTPARPILISEPGELDNPRAFRTLLMPARLPEPAAPRVRVEKAIEPAKPVEVVEAVVDAVAHVVKEIEPPKPVRAVQQAVRATRPVRKTRTVKAKTETEKAA